MPKVVMRRTSNIGLAITIVTIVITIGVAGIQPPAMWTRIHSLIRKVRFQPIAPTDVRFRR